MKPIRILIVEVGDVLMEGLRVLLMKQKDFNVKTETFIADAINNFKIFDPNVIMIDRLYPQLPDKDIEIIKTIKNEFPSAYIIAVDLLPDNNRIFEYIKAGTSGFILREANLDEILETIRTVSNGKKVIPEEMTDALFSQIGLDGGVVHREEKD